MKWEYGIRRHWEYEGEQPYTEDEQCRTESEARNRIEDWEHRQRRQRAVRSERAMALKRLSLIKRQVGDWEEST